MQVDEGVLRRLARGVLEALHELHHQGRMAHSNLCAAHALLDASSGAVRLCSLSTAVPLQPPEAPGAPPPPPPPHLPQPQPAGLPVQLHHTATESGSGPKDSPAAEAERGPLPLWRWQQRRRCVPWMAPEVARGEAVAAASDIWSLGCTLLELATGEAPWRGGASPAGPGAPGGGAEEELLQRIGWGGAEAVPPLPPGLSGQAKSFLRCCLARDPRDRPPAQQLLFHPFVLYQMAHPHSPHPLGEPRSLRTGLPGRWSPLPLPLAAGGAVALGSLKHTLPGGLWAWPYSPWGTGLAGPVVPWGLAPAGLALPGTPESLMMGRAQGRIPGAGGGQQGASWGGGCKQGWCCGSMGCCACCACQQPRSCSCPRPGSRSPEQASAAAAAKEARAAAGSPPGAAGASNPQSSGSSQGDSGLGSWKSGPVTPGSDSEGPETHPRQEQGQGHRRQMQHKGKGQEQRQGKGLGHAQAGELWRNGSVVVKELSGFGGVGQESVLSLLQRQQDEPQHGLEGEEDSAGDSTGEPAPVRGGSWGRAGLQQQQPGRGFLGHEGGGLEKRGSRSYRSASWQDMSAETVAPFAAESSRPRADTGLRPAAGDGAAALVLSLGQGSPGPGRAEGALAGAGLGLRPALSEGSLAAFVHEGGESKESSGGGGSGGEAAAADRTTHAQWEREQQQQQEQQQEQQQRQLQEAEGHAHAVKNSDNAPQGWSDETQEPKVDQHVDLRLESTGGASQPQAQSSAQSRAQSHAQSQAQSQSHAQELPHEQAQAQAYAQAQGQAQAQAQAQAHESGRDRMLRALTEIDEGSFSEVDSFELGQMALVGQQGAPTSQAGDLRDWKQDEGQGGAAAAPAQGEAGGDCAAVALPGSASAAEATRAQRAWHLRQRSPTPHAGALLLPRGAGSQGGQGEDEEGGESDNSDSTSEGQEGRRRLFPLGEEQEQEEEQDPQGSEDLERWGTGRSGSREPGLGPVPVRQRNSGGFDGVLLRSRLGRPTDAVSERLRDILAGLGDEGGSVGAEARAVAAAATATAVEGLRQHQVVSVEGPWHQPPPQGLELQVGSPASSQGLSSCSSSSAPAPGAGSLQAQAVWNAGRTPRGSPAMPRSPNSTLSAESSGADSPKGLSRRGDGGREAWAQEESRGGAGDAAGHVLTQLQQSKQAHLHPQQQQQQQHHHQHQQQQHQQQQHQQQPHQQQHQHQHQQHQQQHHHQHQQHQQLHHHQHQQHQQQQQQRQTEVQLVGPRAEAALFRSVLSKPGPLPGLGQLPRCHSSVGALRGSASLTSSPTFSPPFSPAARNSPGGLRPRHCTSTERPQRTSLAPPGAAGGEFPEPLPGGQGMQAPSGRFGSPLQPGSFPRSKSQSATMAPCAAGQGAAAAGAGGKAEHGPAAAAAGLPEPGAAAAAPGALASSAGGGPTGSAAGGAGPPCSGGLMQIRLLRTVSHNSPPPSFSRFLAKDSPAPSPSVRRGGALSGTGTPRAEERAKGSDRGDRGLRRSRDAAEGEEELWTQGLQEGDSEQGTGGQEARMAEGGYRLVGPVAGAGLSSSLGQGRRPGGPPGDRPSWAPSPGSGELQLPGTLGSRALLRRLNAHSHSHSQGDMDIGKGSLRGEAAAERGLGGPGGQSLVRASGSGDAPRVSFGSPEEHWAPGPSAKPQGRRDGQGQGPGQGPWHGQGQGQHWKGSPGQAVQHRRAGSHGPLLSSWHHQAGRGGASDSTASEREDSTDQGWAQAAGRDKFPLAQAQAQSQGSQGGAPARTRSVGGVRQQQRPSALQPTEAEQQQQEAGREGQQRGEGDAGQGEGAEGEEGERVGPRGAAAGQPKCRRSSSSNEVLATELVLEGEAASLLRYASGPQPAKPGPRQPACQPLGPAAGSNLKPGGTTGSLGLPFARGGWAPSTTQGQTPAPGPQGEHQSVAGTRAPRTRQGLLSAAMARSGSASGHPSAGGPVGGIHYFASSSESAAAPSAALGDVGAFAEPAPIVQALSLGGPGRGGTVVLARATGRVESTRDPGHALTPGSAAGTQRA